MCRCGSGQTDPEWMLILIRHQGFSIFPIFYNELHSFEEFISRKLKAEVTKYFVTLEHWTFPIVGLTRMRKLRVHESLRFCTGVMRDDTL